MEGVFTENKRTEGERGRLGKEFYFILAEFGVFCVLQATGYIAQFLSIPLEARLRKGPFDNLCSKPNSYVVLDFQQGGGSSLCLLKLACVKCIKWWFSLIFSFMHIVYLDHIRTPPHPPPPLLLFFPFGPYLLFSWFSFMPDSPMREYTWCVSF